MNELTFNENELRTRQCISDIVDSVLQNYYIENYIHLLYISL